jgi:uncharacterized protein
VSVAWLDWSARAFARSEAERKPILLSLVTAWSDECATMDRTTFGDPGVMSLIDEAFIPVRVDADRHPDVNERYTLGGWPTTVFLTSSGAILSGGTYFSVAEMIAALHQVSDAYPTIRSVRLKPDRDPLPPEHSREVRLEPGHAIDHFRALLLDRFDPVYGGFGTAPKLPHPFALLFALSLPEDRELSQVVTFTLERLSALWDPVEGGFYRYADAADWSHPGMEKTLEENAALLHVYVEAAVRGHREPRDRAAAIVRWVRSEMADQANGGFYNAQASGGKDHSMYVDRNAMMVGAFIRAAALFDDIWLRDFALKSLEAIVVPTYAPGDGVGHAGPVRGLLTDQVHVASALIWAHAATGQLPYSMLAAELMQFAIRQMWSDEAGRFRDRVRSDDPVMPFDLNCHAAYVLDRLGVLTGDKAHRDRARRILDTLAEEYLEQDLFGAVYALAVREVIDGQPPAGLELAKVDWHLG